MQSNTRLVLLVTACTVFFVFLPAATPLFAADKEKVLHNFGKGTDGVAPYASLVFDTAGNLYGTTSGGGGSFCGYDGCCGTIFQLTPIGSGKWKETELFRFDDDSQIGCNPFAGLILDAKGNLYGTASGGGDSDNGTVFRLTPKANGEWDHTVLYSFAGDPDGSFPVAGVIFDAAGNLYGTTAAGGPLGDGTVFELAPQTNGLWKENVLYTFPANDTDGRYPQGGLIIDTAGNLYGTTCCGGPYGSSCSPNNQGCGTVFELLREGNGQWKEKILHNFIHNGKDGYNPDAALVFDAAGNLYGTAPWGGDSGTGCAVVDGCGIVFELSPRAKGKWTEKMLHNFQSNGKDGTYPEGGLIFNAAGNLYGTTTGGGAYGSEDCGGYNCGTAFKLAPGPNGKWTEKVLHSFGNGKDGDIPSASLIFDTAGNLYGTTAAGGTVGNDCGVQAECGTVFEITP